MTSNMNTFSDSVALFAEKAILGPLSVWLKGNKGVEVSIDEMKKVLDMPATNQMLSAPTFQAPSFSAPRPNLTTTRKPRRGRGEIKGKCKYTFIKGKRSGFECGKSVYEEGSDYCTTCRNKKGAQRKSARDGVSNILGGALAPPSMLPKATNNGPPTRQVPSNVRLSVNRVKGQQNLMRETTYGFILSVISGHHVAKKILKDPNADISEARDLTPDEKALAKSIGLAVIGSSGPKPEKPPMASLSSLNPSGSGLSSLPPFNTPSLPAPGGTALPALNNTSLPAPGGTTLPAPGGTTLPPLNISSLPSLPPLDGTTLPSFDSAPIPNIGGFQSANLNGTPDVREDTPKVNLPDMSFLTAEDKPVAEDEPVG